MRYYYYLWFRLCFCLSYVLPARMQQLMVDLPLLDYASTNLVYGLVAISLVVRSDERSISLNAEKYYEIKQVNTDKHQQN